MIKTLFATLFVILIGLPLSAHQPEGNPFKKLGYKAKVATFGDKEEFHDQSQIVQIGSVWFDTSINEVVGLVLEKDDLVELSPELISTTIDPHCEKYYSISPYAYCFNNPIRLIDPDGRDVWEMDHEGKVRYIRPSDVHTMYALNAEGQRTGNSITLKDATIFENLTSTGSNSKHTSTYSLGNPSDLASVFLFAADNSNAEWRFSRFDVGNGDQYALGTIHDKGTSISTKEMGFAAEAEIAFIHSHPTPYGSAKEEWGSMGWKVLSDTEATNYRVPKGHLRISGDSDNVRINNSNLKSYDNYLTYFPHTGNIYQVRGARQPAFIRNIKNHNNNPQRIFWGTLNGK